MYFIFKDFAQPAATVLAALAVLALAYRQWRTSEQQAYTALDQLRFNLFQKRYAIYLEIKNLLITILHESNNPDFTYFSIILHYVTIDESVFFFSPELCAWLQKVKADCQFFFGEHTAEKELLPSSSPMPPRIYEAKRKILSDLSELTERFRDDLIFRQLTGRGK